MKNNHVMGVIPSTIDIRDYKIKTDIACTAGLPEEFKLATPTVKNQGAKPTCAAHAGSTIVEGYFEKQHEKYRKFSTEWIYGNRYTWFGDGMSLRDVLTTLHNLGDPYEVDCSGNSDVFDAMAKVNTFFDELSKKAYPHRITRYFKATSVNGMKAALFSHGYLLASITVRVHDHLKNNVWTTDLNDEAEGGHAVVIYGWDERGWLVQNSWGSFWGDGGRFVIPFDFKFNEVWGTEDSLVETDDLDKPFSSPIWKIFVKIINFIVNLFRKKGTK